MAVDSAIKLHFELVSPERLLMDVEAKAILVPGSEGDFLALPKHAPMMSTLHPGVISIFQDENKAPEQIFVRGGFVEVTPLSVVVLAEEAIPLKELNRAEIKQRIADAHEDLEDAKTDEERRKAREEISKLTQLSEAIR